MPKDILYVHQQLQKLTNRVGTFIGELFLMAAIIVTWQFTDVLNPGYDWLIIGGLLGWFCVSLARLLDLFKIGRYPLLYISSYHLLAPVLFIFIAPLINPFLFIWLILLMTIHLYYGRKGLLLSALWIVFITEIAFMRSLDIVNAEVLALAVTQGLLLASAGYLLTRVQTISREEARVIAATMKERHFEHQRLVTLINNFGNAVLVTNEAGSISLYNAAALDLLDTNLSLENQPLNKFLKLYDSDDKSVDLIKEIKKQNIHMARSDLRHKFDNGEFLNLYVNMTPIRLGYRHHEGGYTIILRDITKEKSLEEERDEFISVVSHELRTPITIAEGNISNAMLINDQADHDEKISKALSLAHDQVLFLAQMINDLATLSRAERNVLDVDLEPIDAEDMIKQLKDEYEPEATAKKLKFQTSLKPQTPKVMNSAMYVKEILQNFVTNALKYTKEGRIEVHAEGDKQGNVVFTVSDSGIGISKSDQRKLFEKFFRSEDFRTRESNGTGLGLYVTKKLASRIGATIGVESELNKGSTFIITIPSLSDKEAEESDTPTKIDVKAAE